MTLTKKRVRQRGREGSPPVSARFCAAAPGQRVTPGTMPEFSHCFRGLAAKRKLTHSELVRAIRFMIAAEFEAIQLYEQLAESTCNELARKVLLDITKEEKEHVGEFRHLLALLAPEDEPDYAEGAQEAAGYLAPLVDAKRHSSCECSETGGECEDSCSCGCHGEDSCS